MSTLMFWNKQNAANQNNETKNGKRNWLHAPDALLNGHIVYLVKFLGNTPVEQAKGIEVVKDAIRRLQFAQQMKKAETGNNPKTKKVEITVSVDGVAIQEPRTQKILYQFPLHNISYCADEKGVKKFFSFIAKNNPGNVIQNGTATTPAITPTTPEETHECFVFISSKLASDITLTIGQAFDLAYRRFVNDSGKTGELTKIQTQNKQLEKTVSAYKQRLKELTDLIPKPELDRVLSRLGIRDILEVPQENGCIENNMNGNKTPDIQNSNTNIIMNNNHNNNNVVNNNNNNNDEKLLIETSNKHVAPTVPPRNIQNQINNTIDAFKSGQKMDELLLNSDSDSDFDPRAEENENDNKITNDLFGFEPPKTFGQQLFANNNNNIHNNNLTNGTNVNGNGIGYGNGNISPNNQPPLLAPPPKAAVPRRGAPNSNGSINNNNMNGSQDLFGSAPFSPNATSIFDANIGPDTYNTTPNANEFKNCMTGIGMINKSVPKLELNSMHFGDEVKNPFNESGFHDSSGDINFGQSGPSDIRMSTNYPESLDNSWNKTDVFSTGNNLQLSASQENINPFGTQSPTVNETKSKDFVKANPFTKAAESLLGTRSNYDALRNSPEIEAMQRMHTSTGIGNTNSAATTTNNSTSSSGKEKKITLNYDIFKEAANAAFSELNNGNPTKRNNEFSNKMADVNLNAQSSSSFGFHGQSNFNTSKTITVDDFSLESLDPLRK